MAEKKVTREAQGTFAELYDVQEQLNRRNVKPLGRPPKKVQRKPTTVHLTKAEVRNLNKLHHLVSDQISVNRSELVGVAIDVLALLMEEKGKNALESAQIQDIEALRQFISDFIKS
jgi:hypothetical protein